MIKGTIIFPFSHKQGINDLWIQKFKENFTMDPKEWAIVLFDTTYMQDGEPVYRDLMSMGFHNDSVYDCVPNRIPNDDDTKHYPRFLKMGTAIAHVWNDCRKYVKGDLVLIVEDDIIIPKGGFETLIHEFNKRPSCGIIGAIQRFKGTKKPKDILAWNDGEHIDDTFFPDPRPLKIKSIATGMVVTYASLFKSVNMVEMVEEYHASQDIAYCLYLNEIHNLETVIDGRVETLHIGPGLRKYGNISHNKSYAIAPLPTNMFRSLPQIKRTTGEPIFICGFAGRSGTTWIQRILMSHPDIMMYGEPQGAISGIESATTKIFGTYIKNVVKTSQKIFKQYGAGGFIPNLSPQHKDGSKTVRKLLVNALYESDSGSVWGIKSINWTPTRIIKMFRSFPKASFIFVDRDLDKMKPSFDKVGKEWWDVDWSVVEGRVKGMMRFMSILPVGMHHTRILHSRIEDSPERMCDVLEEFLNLESGSLNRDVARLRVSFSNDLNQTKL